MRDAPPSAVLEKDGEQMPSLAWWRMLALGGENTPGYLNIALGEQRIPVE